MSSRREIKVAFCGKSNAGKSTLSSCLQDHFAIQALRRHAPRVSNLEPQEGITITPLVPFPFKQSAGVVYCNFWDYTGSPIYQSIHPYFLTDRALYVLVCNMTLEFNCNGLREWFKTIQFYVHKPTIMVVGTHLDLLPKKNQKDAVKRFKEEVTQLRGKSTAIAGAFCVSCLHGKNMKDFYDEFINLVSQQKICDPLPADYQMLDLYLEKVSEQRVASKSGALITCDDFARVCEQCNIMEGKASFLALKALEYLGHIMYINVSEERRRSATAQSGKYANPESSFIATRPEFVVKLIAYVFSRRSEIVNGKISLDFVLNGMWPTEFTSAMSRYEMITLLECFDVVHRFPEEQYLLAPSLFSDSFPDLQKHWPVWYPHSVQITREFSFTFLPPSFFYRLIVDLQCCYVAQCWASGILIKSDGIALLTGDVATSTITIAVRGDEEHENPLMLFLSLVGKLEAFFENQVQVSHPQVKLPCPLCITSMVKSPTYFTLHQCSLASTDPTLQNFILCNKDPLKPHSVHIPNIAPELFSFGLNSRIIDPKELQRGERLAEGGFAVVYKSRYEEQDVALKVLNASAGKVQTSEFRREVDMMSKMNHNALVHLIGFSIREPLTLVLELMELGDLNAYLKTHPNVPLELKVRLAGDIAAGMCYMHALTPKIVHCDLKTPNILLAHVDPSSSLPCAKVGDFGLAKELLTESFRGQEATARDVVNPTWLAPEILSGKPYGTPCDVYAFGIIGWEIFTQREPFLEYEFHLEREIAIIAGARPALTDEIPTPYGTMLSHCWTADVQHRPTFQEIRTVYFDSRRRTSKSTLDAPVNSNSASDITPSSSEIQNTNSSGTLNVYRVSTGTTTNPPTRIKREIPTLLTGARARAASSSSVIIDPHIREKALAKRKGLAGLSKSGSSLEISKKKVFNNKTLLKKFIYKVTDQLYTMPNPDRVEQSHLLSEINELVVARSNACSQQAGLQLFFKANAGELNANANATGSAANASMPATAQYKVFNLSKQIYDYGIFTGVVSEYSMKPKSPPTFRQLLSCVTDIVDWIHSYPGNFAILHSDEIEGFTPCILLVICAKLIFTNQRYTDIYKEWSDRLQQQQLPSFSRYLEYFQNSYMSTNGLLETSPQSKKQLLLQKIVFSSVPTNYGNFSGVYELLFCLRSMGTKIFHKQKLRNSARAIEFDCKSFVVSQDLRIEFFHKNSENIVLGLSVNISHESFPSRLAVTKRGLDFASREQAEKHFPDSFTVDLIFGQVATSPDPTDNVSATSPTLLTATGLPPLQISISPTWNNDPWILCAKRSPGSPPSHAPFGGLAMAHLNGVGQISSIFQTQLSMQVSITPSVAGTTTAESTAATGGDGENNTGEAVEDDITFKPIKQKDGTKQIPLIEPVDILSIRLPSKFERERERMALVDSELEAMKHHRERGFDEPALDDFYNTLEKEGWFFKERDSKERTSGERSRGLISSPRERTSGGSGSGGLNSNERERMSTSNGANASAILPGGSTLMGPEDAAEIQNKLLSSRDAIAKEKEKPSSLKQIIGGIGAKTFASGRSAGGKNDNASQQPGGDEHGNDNDCESEVLSGGGENKSHLGNQSKSPSSSRSFSKFATKSEKSKENLANAALLNHSGMGGIATTGDGLDKKKSSSAARVLFSARPSNQPIPITELTIQYVDDPRTSSGVERDHLQHLQQARESRTSEKDCQPHQQATGSTSLPGSHPSSAHVSQEVLTRRMNYASTSKHATTQLQDLNSISLQQHLALAEERQSLKESSDSTGRGSSLNSPLVKTDRSNPEQSNSASVSANTSPQGRRRSGSLTMVTNAFPKSSSETGQRDVLKSSNTRNRKTGDSVSPRERNDSPPKGSVIAASSSEPNMSVSPRKSSGKGSTTISRPAQPPLNASTPSLPQRGSSDKESKASHVRASLPDVLFYNPFSSSLTATNSAPLRRASPGVDDALEQALFVRDFDLTNAAHVNSEPLLKLRSHLRSSAEFDETTGSTPNSRTASPPHSNSDHGGCSTTASTTPSASGSTAMPSSAPSKRPSSKLTKCDTSAATTRNSSLAGMNINSNEAKEAGVCFVSSSSLPEDSSLFKLSMPPSSRSRNKSDPNRLQHVRVKADKETPHNAIEGSSNTESTSGSLSSSSVSLNMSGVMPNVGDASNASSYSPRAHFAPLPCSGSLTLSAENSPLQSPRKMTITPPTTPAKKVHRSMSDLRSYVKESNSTSSLAQATTASALSSNQSTSPSATCTTTTGSDSGDGAASASVGAKKNRSASDFSGASPTELSSLTESLMQKRQQAKEAKREKEGAKESKEPTALGSSKEIPAKEAGTVVVPREQRASASKFRRVPDDALPKKSLSKRSSTVDLVSEYSETEMKALSASLKQQKLASASKLNSEDAK